MGGGLLASALLGGAKGGLEAGKENLDRSIDAEKQAALDLREKNMYRFRQGLMDDATQKQNIYNEGKTEKSNTFTAEQNRLNNASREKIAGMGSGSAKTEKALARKKEEQYRSLQASVAGLGGQFDPETGMLYLPTNKEGAEVTEADIKALRSKGFEIVKAKGNIRKEDRPYWLTGDDNYQGYQIGGFNDVMPGEDNKPASLFDELESKVGTPTVKTTPDGGGLVEPKAKTKPKTTKEPVKDKVDDAPKETPSSVSKPDLNPKLPADPSKWNVKKSSSGGKESLIVVLPRGEKIKLTEAEVRVYYNSKGKKFRKGVSDTVGGAFDYIKKQGSRNVEKG